jgi:assimilatory nitrate reductase catalytic subunit
VALFNGMLHLMLWEGLTDAPTSPRTPAASTRCATACATSRPRTCASCAASAKTPVQAARWFAACAGAARRPTLSLYCQGLNQSSSGTMKNAALINLHLATGQIGKPGAGPFSLTGQPNAMGGARSAAWPTC